jgi:acyl carrier protein
MDLREEVVQALAEKAAALFGRKAEEFGPETRFVEDLDAKSVNYVQFSAALEDIYDVEVPFMEFRRKKTFAEAADYMAQLLGE